MGLFAVGSNGPFYWCPNFLIYYIIFQTKIVASPIYCDVLFILKIVDIAWHRQNWQILLGGGQWRGLPYVDAPILESTYADACKENRMIACAFLDIKIMVKLYQKEEEKRDRHASMASWTAHSLFEPQFRQM